MRHVDDLAAACKGSPPSQSEPVELAPRKWSGTLPDKFVALAVELVSEPRLTATVGHLASYPTRHTDSTHIAAARDWIATRFTGMGYPDVVKRTWSAGGHSGHNVVCTKPAGAGAGVVLVCAHYDSRNASLADATGTAPGADDNASGVAALLEIATLLQGVALASTLLFVAFSGEEQGLLGSTALAAELQASGTPISLVINLDMVGRPPADGSITVERDIGNTVTANDAASLAAANTMLQAAADYTTLTTKLGPVYSSDYMPFEARGYTVIGAYEGEGNPDYHRSTDAAATVNGGYLAQVTRMVLATLLVRTLPQTGERTSGVDLYVRDSLADTGSQPSPVPHWTSPDIWVRNASPADGDDPDLGDQTPIVGVDNHLYVRVHNRGTIATPSATVSVYRCDPGTGMVWPSNFMKVASTLTTGPVPAAGSVRVGPFTWTPQIVGHECILAIASTVGDHAVPDVLSQPVRHDLLVRYDNNVGQRNVSPQLAVPGGMPKYRLTIYGGVGTTANDWELDARTTPRGARIAVTLPRSVTVGAHLRGFAEEEGSARRARFVLDGGKSGVLRGMQLEAGSRVRVSIAIDLPDREVIAPFTVVATQHQDDHIAGRVSLPIDFATADAAFGNARTHEVHVNTCRFRALMRPHNVVPFATVPDAIARGFDGCRVCLPEFDRGSSMTRSR